MSGSPLQKLITSFLVLALHSHAFAQSVKTSIPDLDSLSGYIQMKYGLDQELFNGFQYYKRYVQYKGDPFFPEDSFYEGSLSYKGLQYDHVQLKYDCYSQNLILEYTDNNKIYDQLLLQSMHIDSFWLEAYRFQKLSLFSEEEPMIYQILNSGTITCYVHWKTILTSISYNFEYTHEFSAPIGEIYIKYRGQIKPIVNKNSFISLFPESLHQEIKKYFRQQRFSFRSADLMDIQKLLIFSSKLEATLSKRWKRTYI